MKGPRRSPLAKCFELDNSEFAMDYDDDERYKLKRDEWDPWAPNSIFVQKMDRNPYKIAVLILEMITDDAIMLRKYASIFEFSRILKTETCVLLNKSIDK